MHTVCAAHTVCEKVGAQPPPRRGGGGASTACTDASKPWQHGTSTFMFLLFILILLIYLALIIIRIIRIII
jgi:hypothetical protein